MSKIVSINYKKKQMWNFQGLNGDLNEYKRNAGILNNVNQNFKICL